MLPIVASTYALAARRGRKLLVHHQCCKLVCFVAVFLVRFMARRGTAHGPLHGRASRLRCRRCAGTESSVPQPLLARRDWDAEQRPVLVHEAHSAGRRTSSTCSACCNAPGLHHRQDGWPTGI